MNVELRDYVERIFTEREKAHEAQLKATERALTTAAEALEMRLLAMERAGFVRQAQFDAAVSMFQDRVGKLEQTDANRGGRLWAVGIGLLIASSLLATLVTLAIRHVSG